MLFRSEVADVDGVSLILEEELTLPVAVGEMVALVVADVEGVSLSLELEEELTLAVAVGEIVEVALVVADVVSVSL